MLVCLRNNKRTESNTWHPALVGNPAKQYEHRVEVSVTGTSPVTKMHAKFCFLIESFFVFITNTVLESIKPPRSVSF